MEYYATEFTVRATEFDASYVLGGTPKILDRMRALEEAEGMSASDKGMLTILELALEMHARGIAFLPVDMGKSRARQFVVEGGNIRLPFVSIPKLGEKAADALERERDAGPFLSIADVKRRGKLSSTVIDTMRAMGCFDGMPETEQLSFFDEAFGM